MTFNSFPSIENFHNVRKDVRVGVDTGRITYRPKIKLHGTNAGINITEDGPVAQSRKNVITAGADNMGFAAWMHQHEDFWASAPQSGITFFGEWFGRKIMKGTIASDLPSNYFGVFAIQFGSSDHAFKTTINPDPEVIQNYLEYMAEAAGYMPEGIVIIPWADADTQLDFADEASMHRALEHFNQRISEVEEEDPFIKDVFGYSGPGEGLVYYPVGAYDIAFDGTSTSRWFFSKYVFKAKGEKHKVTKTKKSVQMDPETASNVEDFCDKVLTDARLDQAIMETVGSYSFDKKDIGPFLAWVGQDVKKECQDELEVSGLTWNDVKKRLQARARDWFLSQA